MFTPLTWAQGLKDHKSPLDTGEVSSLIFLSQPQLEIKLNCRDHPSMCVKTLVLGQCKVSLCIPGGTGEAEDGAMPVALEGKPRLPLIHL